MIYLKKKMGQYGKTTKLLEKTLLGENIFPVLNIDLLLILLIFRVINPEVRVLSEVGSIKNDAIVGKNKKILIRNQKNGNGKVRKRKERKKNLERNANSPVQMIMEPMAANEAVGGSLFGGSSF